MSELVSFGRNSSVEQITFPQPASTTVFPQGGSAVAAELTGKLPTGAVPTLGVTGNVSAAGAAQRGSGFTSVKNSTGYYTVTFNTPFSQVPCVQANTVYTSVGFVVVDGSGSGSFCDFRCYDSTGTLTDMEFSFRCVEYA